VKKRTVLISTLAASAGAYLIHDIYKNLSIKYPPERPASDEGNELIHKLLLYFDNPDLAEKDGVIINSKYIIEAVIPAKKYIDGRYDCADFRMQTAMRLLYLHGEKLKSISPDGYNLLCEAFLGAKYWMTEPGEDSACYWSENHQLLFAVSEYLAGQLWAEKKFFNDNITGAEHMNRARKRIGYWMEHVFKNGYTELNSSNYYLFDLCPAANFIQFASEDDSDMVTQMKMCIDLLLYDIVTNMYDYTFTAPTMRAYTDNMVGGSGDKVRQLIDYIFSQNENHKTSTHHMLINFVSMMNAKNKDGKPQSFYKIPEVLLNIGNDTKTRIIKSSTGLDVSELYLKGLVGHSDNQIMAQFGMESFTNPEVIYNTVTYLEANSMFANSFLNYFKVLNIKPLKQKKVLELISEKLNPMPNGIAQQRANLYSYKTANYQLSCFQKYHPGSFGAQQMLSVLNFGGGTVVFTAHPARLEDKKTVSATPGYWAGFGRAPHIAQHENVQLQIFNIPKISGFLELYKVPQFTHTYLPEAFFDSVRVSGRHAFAKKGSVYLALTGADEFSYKNFSEVSAKAFKNTLTDYKDKKFDLIQKGNNQYIIYELSSENNESFEAFISRIKSNYSQFDGKKLTYNSLDKTYELTYGDEFKVNGLAVLTDYKRFDSSYSQTEREPSEIRFDFGGNHLYLNFENAVREIG
jgi:hypothetical protein